MLMSLHLQLKIKVVVRTRQLIPNKQMKLRQKKRQQLLRRAVKRRRTTIFSTQIASDELPRKKLSSQINNQYSRDSFPSELLHDTTHAQALQLLALF